LAVWQFGEFVDANEQTSSLDGRDEVCKALLTARRDRLNRINCRITVAVLDEEEVMPALGQVLLRLLSPASARALNTWVRETVTLIP
jgi:hypothetical protein